jgi:hypothetical protein
MTHAGPKSSETAIQEYVIANDDKSVFNYLKDKSGYINWNDLEDCYEPNFPNKEYDGMTVYDYILHCKGDHNLASKWEDLYYGSTMYSWDLYKENISDKEVSILEELEIVKIV